MRTNATGSCRCCIVFVVNLFMCIILYPLYFWKSIKSDKWKLIFLFVKNRKNHKKGTSVEGARATFNWIFISRTVLFTEIRTYVLLHFSLIPLFFVFSNLKYFTQLKLLITDANTLKVFCFIGSLFLNSRYNSRNE